MGIVSTHPGVTTLLAFQKLILVHLSMTCSSFCYDCVVRCRDTIYGSLNLSFTSTSPLSQDEVLL